MELGVDKILLAKVGIACTSLPINALRLQFYDDDQTKPQLKFLIRVDNFNNA